MAQAWKYEAGKCFRLMAEYFAVHHTPDVCLTICNEGGSRSGKTFDECAFICWLCAAAKRPLTCYILRATLADCKDYTLQDFRRAASLCGLWRENWLKSAGQRPEYIFPNGSVIRFRGLDGAGDNEAYDSDIIFINEALSGVTREQFDSVTMRCRMLVLLDWNPRYTRHWAFDLETRPNVLFTHTTIFDNPHAPQAVVQRVKSYEPTPENIAAGTADDFRWKVYGRGIRAAQEGLVFPRVTWVDSLPEYYDYDGFGLDFGFTNDPTALVRGVVQLTPGDEKNNLYLQELLYTPIDDPESLANAVAAAVGDNPNTIWCDSADKYAKNPEGMVRNLVARQLRVHKAKKFPDSVRVGIDLLGAFNLHIVRSANFEAEQAAYVWDKINGITIDRPIDKYNHLWDAARYLTLSDYRGLIYAAA